MESANPKLRIKAAVPVLPRIGLNMIVKNESHVLEGLFRSVAPLIDTWTIVDTGSADGTPELIERLMAELGKPGHLHRRPWRDFGSNRSEALALARGTAAYHWVIDADDLIVGELRFPELTLPCYYLRYGKGFTYLRQQLFRDDLPWRYVGVLHEYPSCDQDVEIGVLEGNYYIESRRLGARNRDPNKYLNDVRVLEEGLRQEPQNSRYWFYLGQSYFDAGLFEKALEAYRHRVSLKGWGEEVFFAQLKAGLCLERLNAPTSEIISALLEAWRGRPVRAEALYQLSRILRLRGEHELAAMFARQGLAVPQPPDRLFVDATCYSFGLADEFSVAAYYSQSPVVAREGYATCRTLANRTDIPEEVRARATSNLEWYRKKFPEG